MRALSFTRPTGPDALSVADLPLPEPAPGEVRVRVRGSGVHPVDLATVAGAFADVTPDDGTRYVPGWDFAGVVDTPGGGFEPGDPVVGLSFWFAGRHGAHAEYVVVPAAQLAPAPATVPLAAAATLPLNALTAAAALDVLALPHGASLAVTGAAGGVGDFAVQLATARGLRVTGIAAATDQSRVRESGATGFVDRSADLSTALRDLEPGGFDAVFDTALVGAPALAGVRDGGTFLSALRFAVPPSERDIRVDAVEVSPDGKVLADLVSAVDSGALSVRLADAYPLSEGVTAYQRLAGGGVRGGLVIEP
ncbi:NADP-dependent oxidoreductase [Hamadaea tsunoensis]|uniref:NADP-dependent oxidoreductase n=1 Tax=Hamadaea tsunoensis TaxID=53368 RepID=UPI000487886B|nr:NADP-dependent oxidoreductase [Hamadaea tsunoensis]